MTVSPNDVTSRLAQLSRLLDAATEELITADEAAVRAKQRAEVAYARAFLGGEGAMESRRQTALLTCATERLDAEIADAHVRAIRARIKLIETQVDVGRSLNSSLRAEMAMAGTS